MSHVEKEAIVDSLKTKFAGAPASFLVDYQGCTCEELTQLRKELRTSGSSFHVIKNKLAKRAIAESDAQGLDEFLVGPTAVVWSDTDPVSPAKALTNFAKEQEEKFTIKAAFVDGSVVDESQVKALASMPSKEELYAKLLSLFNAPATQLLRTINAPAAQVVRLLAAVRDKKENEN